MGKVSFWRTSPPQRKKSKKARRLERSRPKGTLIRQRKDGGWYFRTKDANGVFRGWTIDAVGTKWLTSLGIKPGQRANGQIIHDMINKGLARTREIEKPSAHASQQAEAQMEEAFDWALYVGLKRKPVKPVKNKKK